MKVEGSVGIHQQTNNESQNNELRRKSAEEVQVVESNQNFPGEKKFIEAIEKANKDLMMTDTSLKFSIHDKTKEVVVKVIDNKTQEAIKEIPSEKILDMVASMMERTGVFLDKKA